MDYDQPGIARDYREGRTLPVETLNLWRDVVADLVDRAGVGRVLDLGCGIGRFIGMLADLFAAPVIGVEPSVKMLAERDRSIARAGFVAAVAEALPLRAECVDVAFLSMVYHHFRSAPDVATELRRVLRPGGHVIVRNGTVEILDGYAFLTFFPEAKAIDAGRMPRRGGLVEVFAEAGFTPLAQRTVSHRIAADHDDYYRKVRLRSLSSLQLIPDDVFAGRLVEFERYCRAAAPGEPVWEPVDVFTFQANAR